MERTEAEREIIEFITYYINKHFKRLNKLLDIIEYEFGSDTNICSLFSGLEGEALKSAMIRETTKQVIKDMRKESTNELVFTVKILRLVKLIPSWIIGKMMTITINRLIDEDKEMGQWD